MSELTLNRGSAALPSGDKESTAQRLPLPEMRRRGENRWRRRLGAARLATPTDGGFRPFRIY
jgi:hypothetical protein